MSEDRDKLHSVESAARFLGGISPWTIRMWLHLGKLRRVKIGRRTFVYESDLAALIKPENKEEFVPADVSRPATGGGNPTPAPTPKEQRHA